MNIKNKIFKYFSFSLFFVFLLNSLASLFFWYASMHQFDLLMHFLGGFTAAIFSFWLIYKKSVFWIESEKKGKLFRVILLMVLIIALLWEVLEFSVQGYFDVTVLADLPDSLSDVLIGLAGGILGTAFAVTRYKKYRNEEPINI